jgi:hypothetical protein
MKSVATMEKNRTLKILLSSAKRRLSIALLPWPLPTQMRTFQLKPFDGRSRPAAAGDSILTRTRRDASQERCEFSLPKALLGVQLLNGHVLPGSPKGPQ